MSGRRASSDRLLRFCLLAYPRAFRRKHGEEMLRVYAALRDDARSRRSTIGLVWWLGRDLFVSACRVRFSRRSRSEQVAASIGRKEKEGRMGILGFQIRRAVRSLTRNPGFAAVTVLTLGLGIGATTAIFSVVEAVMLSPLPYDDGDELVWVLNRYLPEGGLGGVSHPEFWEFRQEEGVFESISALSVTAANLTGLDTPARVQGLQVSPDYFRLLRTPLALGRAFAPEEERVGSAPAVIISHGLWQSAMGGDPDVVGRSILLDGLARTIVGVMGAAHPPLAPYLFPGRTVDYWTPIVIAPGTFNAASLELHNLYVVGRLAEGVTPATAEGAMLETVARLERLYPEIGFAGNREIAVTSLGDRVAGGVGTTLTILLAAVGLVLLVACVNVANVLLARGEARVAEASVHAALGAGRGRLALHGIIESAVIGVAGGVLGILLALLAQQTLVALAPPELPRLDEVGLNLRVFGFCAGVSILAGLLAGLLPSIRLFRGDFLETLKAGGRSGALGGARTLLKRGLVVAQVAAAVIIASAAALLGRSLMELQAVDPGFDSTDLLMVDVNAARSRYSSTEAVRSLYDDLLSRVEAIPGVTAATASWQTPLQTGMSDWPVRNNSEESEWISADPNMVTNSYFETLGMRLVDGRLFDTSDLARDEGAVIVSETAARSLFGEDRAVGRLVNINFDREVWREVVGVVADVRMRGLGREPSPQTYVPLSNVPFGPNPSLTLTVKAGLAPGAFRAALVDVMRSVDPDVPIGQVRSMSGQVALSMGRERFLAILLGTFAGAALLLGAIGVYGLLAYDVTRQRREIGLRIALGAQPDGVLRRVVGRALAMGAIGIAVGVLGSLATARLLEGFLYGVSSTDAVTLVGVALVVLLTAGFASFFPARRAAAVDPLIALREE
jgi:putative ABC transport system permease protein